MFLSFNKVQSVVIQVEKKRPREKKKEAKESGIGKKKRKSTIAPPQTPSIFRTEKVPGQHHQSQRNLDPSRLMQQ
jgi:hypothetical protein